jgi:MinD-like ATPase involved in chromosome partitioning or flagellar assembly
VDVILVTTPDFDSIADAYAHMKLAGSAGSPVSPRRGSAVLGETRPPMIGQADGTQNVPATLTVPEPGGARWRLIVNMTEDEWQARDVHERMNKSCERFLGHRIELLGSVPLDSAVRDSAQNSVPFVLSRPGSGAARAVQAIAAELASSERRPQQAIA